MDEKRARIEPGMAVTIEVKRLHQAIQAHISETDLGVQELLRDAVDSYMNRGGLRREVEEAVAQEMPRLVQSVISQAMWKDGIREAIAEAVTSALTKGLKHG